MNAQDQGVGDWRQLLPAVIIDQGEYPDTLILHAAATGRGLDLIVDPGWSDACPLLEFGGLMSERHYRTGLEEQPYVRADRDGRAMLRLVLAERTRVTLDPVRCDLSDWSIRIVWSEVPRQCIGRSRL